MRRFFVWSALAALVGLLIAGGGYWAYWQFHARFQPVVVDRNQGAVQTLLDGSGWVSGGGGGRPVYIVGYRDSAAMQRYEREEAPKLRAAGVEVRIIVFARPDREGLQQSTAAERATVAELWLSRDWSLYERWTATPTASWTAAGLPKADGNLARMAVVEAGRGFSRDLSELLGGAGLQTSWPLVIWRDEAGFLKACACTDPRSWAFIRDDLGAPDRVAADVPPTGLPEPLEGSAQPLPYPDVPPTTAEPAPTTETPPAPTGPAAPRKAPEATKDEETTFF
ncbi:hypothetical protein [Brevundimonas sp.]|jgi:hypothetical protein|uniref:hypothetical protein n=1 Tax=Brevundimonas sp. TaxID=1871086 RepID=UPI0026064C6D|nr:hypothetical protein [Brevundimonas sp.]